MLEMLEMEFMQRAWMDGRLNHGDNLSLDWQLPCIA